MSAPVHNTNTKGSAGLIFTGLYLLSMIVLFFGERLVLESQGMRIALSSIATCGILAAVIGRIMRRSKIPAAARLVETRILICYLAGVVSVLLYFAQADFVMERLRSVFAEAQSAERYQVALAALWPVIWICAAAPLVFMELSYSTMDITKTLEPGRIRRSSQSGLFLALTICLLFTVNYISSEFNEKVDLSYFKTTAASESSRKMVQNLSEPLEVVLFFPTANEVYELVNAYFEDLGKESKFFKLKHAGSRDGARPGQGALGQRQRGGAAPAGQAEGADHRRREAGAGQEQAQEAGQRVPGLLHEAQPHPEDRLLHRGA